MANTEESRRQREVRIVGISGAVSPSCRNLAGHHPTDPEASQPAGGAGSWRIAPAKKISETRYDAQTSHSMTPRLFVC